MADKKLMFQILADGYQAILNNEADRDGFKVKIATAQVIDTNNASRGAFATTGRMIGNDQITLRIRIEDAVNTYSIKELRLVDAYGGKVFGRIYREDNSVIDVINPAKFAVIIVNIKLSTVSGAVTIVDSSESDATLAGALDGHIASPAAHAWNTITNKPVLTTGNGLMGGGSLNNPLTLTLGIPSQINATSTNSVSANSHSHAIDKASVTVAGVVQLNNTLTSTLTTQALTAAQGKVLEDGKVPYTGATKNIDLNGRELANTGAIKLGDGSNAAGQFIYLGNYKRSADNGSYSILQNANFIGTERQGALSNYNVAGVHVSSLFSDERNAYVRLAATNYALAVQNTAINAGNGLTGGGDLSTSRSLTLGVPSQITATSTNNVSANSHSHAIDKATTAVAGVVQLNNTLTSTLTTQALTAAQGKALQDAKADKASTADGYGITDVYTKSEIKPLSLTAATINNVGATGHTHDVALASTTTAGLVKLSNSILDDSVIMAPTVTALNRTFKIASTSPDTDATLQLPSALVAVPAGEIPSFSGFGYVRTLQYATDQQASQLLTPYASGVSPKMYSRHRHGAVWTAWARIDGADWDAGVNDTGYIANKPNTLANYGITDWVLKAVTGNTTPIADAVGQGVHSYGGGAPDMPTWGGGAGIGACKVMQLGIGTWDSQLAIQGYNECMWIRSRRVAAGTYQAWRRIDGADWAAGENVAGYIANKPTTVAGYGLTDAVTTNTAQTVSGAKTFTATQNISSTSLVGYSSWQDTVALGGNLPVISAGAMGIGFHTLNNAMYLMNITTQTYLAVFNFAEKASYFYCKVAATDGFYKGSVEVAYSNVAMTAGNGLTGGGDLSTARTFALGLPSNITASTVNSVTDTSHTHFIDVASTTVAGVVQLNNTLTSALATQALTAAQGKVLQDTKADKNINLTAGNGLTGGGDLATNRAFALGVPTTITSDSTNAVTATSHSHAIDLATTATAGVVQLHNTLANTSVVMALTAAQGKVLQDTKADKTIAITAGNGLTGGGDLSAGRTVVLGLPSNITAATTNAVTATSHTHFIDVASTTIAGVVQLNNTLTSTLTTQALTAAQGKVLEDGKVPYTGATKNIDLNGRELANTGAIRLGDGNNAAGQFIYLGNYKRSADNGNHSVIQNANFIGTERHGALSNFNVAGVHVSSLFSDERNAYVRLAATNYALAVQNTAINAGNGLTGGGDLSANRTVALGLPSSITAATTNSLTATSHTHFIDVASTAIAGVVQLNNTLTSTLTTQALTAAQGKVLQDAKADKTTALTAGDGLTGGGDLSAGRTVALGVPSNITAATTNSVTATSHTHFIDVASTAVAGVVQLNNTLTSTLATQALTAAQGKVLQDAKADKTINLTAGNGLTGGGTLAANRTLDIDKATAAQLTAGTANKVITADVIAPFLNKAYTNLTTSRSMGVTYTNSTGYEIWVYVDGRVDGGASSAVAYVDGVVVNRLATISQTGVSVIGTFSFAVPAGATYQVAGMGVAHTSAPYKWVEYR